MCFQVIKKSQESAIEFLTFYVFLQTALYIINSRHGRLLPPQRRHGDAAASYAGHVAVFRCPFHIDIAYNMIAQAAVQIAFFRYDVVINLYGLRHDADVAEADIAGRRYVDVQYAGETAPYDDLFH